jgi:hypothetical protein
MTAAYLDNTTPHSYYTIKPPLDRRLPRQLIQIHIAA